MLARRSLTRAVAQPAAFGAAPINARNMATLREIELRLKSVRNIEKITKVCMVELMERGRLIPWYFFYAVDENDCFYQTLKGPEGHASWKGLWYR